MRWFAVDNSNRVVVEAVVCFFRLFIEADVGRAVETGGLHLKRKGECTIEEPEKTCHEDRHGSSSKRLARQREE